MIRIAGKISGIPSSVDSIFLFFDSSIDASFFFEKPNDKEYETQIGCSTGSCDYY
jgi:hypothetical protein